MAGLTEVCPYCKQDHSEEYLDRLEEAPNMLYCGDCGSYLGSLGAKSCHCGWNVLKE